MLPTLVFECCVYIIAIDINIIIDIHINIIIDTNINIIDIQIEQYPARK